MLRVERSAGYIVFRIIDDKPEYLFLIREDDTLDYPKGHIEKGENELDAANRELKEEAGIEVKRVAGFRYVYNYIFRDKYSGSNDLVKKYVTIFLGFLGDPNAKITISYEHKGYVWLSYDEAIDKIFKDEIGLLSSANSYILKFIEKLKIDQQYLKLKDELNLKGNFVAGEGSLNADLMLIGESPGEEENKQLRPFVGRSGKLLDKILKDLSLDRESIFITSIFPIYINGEKPSKDQIERSKPLLWKIIDIIKPKIVVLMGEYASSLIDEGAVTANHGRLIEKNGYKFMITVHPAAALRSNEYKEILEGDLRKATEQLNIKK
ncbi:MAG: type-4 uracil-DNA glycosylase [Candidatus Micrarchaeota archaeon]|nr:MAG: type-4 uracil-DNA glycosylase [Candidatus Micrarchaeota archaeon]